MLKLVVSRLWQGLVVLVIVSALTFTLLAAAGGDALTALRGDPLMSEATIEGLHRVYGLDEPFHLRYARWLTQAARGNLGFSFYYHAPVAGIVWPRLRNTLVLAFTSLVLAWSFSFVLGAWAARRRGAWIDRLCGLVILLSASTPRLVLALAALVFAARASLFTDTPASLAATGSGFSLARLLLPALVLCAPLVALFLAQTREGLRAALDEEFVRVARAKGLTERAVVVRHALRAALNPLITILGYSLGGAISGSVIVETVLGWPGVGELSVVAVRSRDVPLLMAVVLITSTAVLAGNLLADILLRANDPRLRVEEQTRPTASFLSFPANASTPDA